MTPEEEKKCQQAFQVLVKDYDKPLHEQIIDAGELKSLIEMMGQKITDEEIFRMVSEADRKNDGKITYKVFRQIIVEQKKNELVDNEEDTLDAFVSLGGESEGRGNVDAKKLIDIIKH